MKNLKLFILVAATLGIFTAQAKWVAGETTTEKGGVKKTTYTSTSAKDITACDKYDPATQRRTLCISVNRPDHYYKATYVKLANSNRQVGNLSGGYTRTEKVEPYKPTKLETDQLYKLLDEFMVATGVNSAPLNDPNWFNELFKIEG